jgi:hypothetical protein
MPKWFKTKLHISKHFMCLIFCNLFNSNLDWHYQFDIDVKNVVTDGINFVAATSEMFLLCVYELKWNKVNWFSWDLQHQSWWARPHTLTRAQFWLRHFEYIRRNRPSAAIHVNVPTFMRCYNKIKTSVCILCNILPGILVTIDGVWIGNLIYWSFKVKLSL